MSSDADGILETIATMIRICSRKLDACSESAATWHK